MKSDIASERAPVTHTHTRIGIFWFFRITRGSLEFYYTIDTK